MRVGTRADRVTALLRRWFFMPSPTKPPAALLGMGGCSTAWEHEAVFGVLNGAATAAHRR